MVEREETKESSTGHRHKEISREIHGRAVTAGAPRGLTRRQRVPLSYQLIAGRFLSPWDVFSHFGSLSPCLRSPSLLPPSPRSLCRAHRADRAACIRTLSGLNL